MVKSRKKNAGARKVRRKPTLRRIRVKWRADAADAAKVTPSTGNVFADIGIPNAKEHAIKAELVRAIAGLMKERDLNQAKAAEQLEISQPDVSKMLRGHFREFSVERLLRFLTMLGRDVEIAVGPSRETGRSTDQGNHTSLTGLIEAELGKPLRLSKIRSTAGRKFWAGRR